MFARALCVCRAEGACRRLSHGADPRESINSQRQSRSRHQLCSLSPSILCKMSEASLRFIQQTALIHIAVKLSAAHKSRAKSPKIMRNFQWEGAIVFKAEENPSVLRE
jgi:hypothetical protein